MLGIFITKILFFITCRDIFITCRDIFIGAGTLLLYAGTYYNQKYIAGTFLLCDGTFRDILLAGTLPGHSGTRDIPGHSSIYQKIYVNVKKYMLMLKNIC